MGGSSKAPEIQKADTGPAIEQFRLGYEAIKSSYPTALKEYEDAIKSGTQAAIEAVTGAQLMALPFSDTAKSAMTEMRSFLGLDPISPSKVAGVKARGMVDQLRASEADPAQLERLESLVSKMESAETIDDPSARATALSEIERESTTLSQDPAFADFAPQIKNVSDQFSTTYSEEKGKALTGEQIQERVTQLPGYQFELAAGQQTMERSAAAQGNLLSGGSLIAAREYGGDFASQAYQKHLTRLSNLAEQNLPFANQQINAQMEKANLQRGQGGLLAGARMGTTQSIAEAERTYRAQAGQIEWGAETEATRLQNQQNKEEAAKKMSTGKLIGSIVGGVAGGFATKTPQGAATGAQLGGQFGGQF